MLRALAPRVCVVQLWRQLDRTRDEWVYLGRFPPEECDIQLVAERFGGGSYRARLFGRWDRALRREEYLTQVPFAINADSWPATPEAIELIRRHQQR